MNTQPAGPKRDQPAGSGEVNFPDRYPKVFSQNLNTKKFAGVRFQNLLPAFSCHISESKSQDEYAYARACVCRTARDGAVSLLPDHSPASGLLLIVTMLPVT